MKTTIAVLAMTAALSACGAGAPEEKQSVMPPPLLCASTLPASAQCVAWGK